MHVVADSTKPAAKDFHLDWVVFKQCDSGGLHGYQYL